MLAVVEERPSNLVGQRTRSVNQLMRCWLSSSRVALHPSCAPTGSRAAGHGPPLTAGDRARKQVAWDLVAEVGGLDRRLAVIGQRIQDSVAALGSRLPPSVGVGPVIAGRLLGRTGRASRFPTPAHFASSTGAAPVEVASGEHARHRLSRAGDRQLNHALPLIALVQVGTPGCAGDHYFRRKLAEGKTTREAMPCLKRRIADHLWRVMLSDEQARNHHQPQAA